MARSTLPPSTQQNAGLIPPYRPSASSTISSTWIDSKYPNSTSQEPPRAWVRGRPSTSTQSPSSARNPNSFLSSNPASFTTSSVNPSSSHGKLHKKNGSASSTPNIKASDINDTLGDFDTDVTPPPHSRITEPFTKSPSPSSAEKSKTKGGIKPLLRKLTPQETGNSLDLSRSAAENEGLGIYTSVDRERRTGDPVVGSIDRRGPFHNRSISGTSQFSTQTNSSGHKPGSQYVHPMRQTPRPYTPPASIIGSEYSGEAGRITAESEHSQNPGLGERTTSFNSTHTPQSGLRLHTGSLTKLGTSSQTNLAGTPTSFWGPESMSMADTISPISRSSFDRSFRMRGRTNTDPATRAASIQAARRAFEEKEAAKTRRIEKQQLKALDREARKRDKQDQSLTPVESREKSKSRFEDPLENEPADSIRGVDYGSLPREEEKVAPIYPAARPDKTRRVKGTKSNWVLFLTWLRTRIFKLKRKVSHNGEH